MRGAGWGSSSTRNVLELVNGAAESCKRRCQLSTNPASPFAAAWTRVCPHICRGAGGGLLRAPPAAADPLLVLDSSMPRLHSVRWDPGDLNVVGVTSTATRQLLLFDLEHTQVGCQGPGAGVAARVSGCVWVGKGWERGQTAGQLRTVAATARVN